MTYFCGFYGSVNASELQTLHKSSFIQFVNIKFIPIISIKFIAEIWY